MLFCQFYIDEKSIQYFLIGYISAINQNQQNISSYVCITVFPLDNFIYFLENSNLFYQGRTSRLDFIIFQFYRKSRRQKSIRHLHVEHMLELCFIRHLVAILLFQVAPIFVQSQLGVFRIETSSSTSLSVHITCLYSSFQYPIDQI